MKLYFRNRKQALAQHGKRALSAIELASAVIVWGEVCGLSAYLLHLPTVVHPIAATGTLVIFAAHLPIKRKQCGGGQPQQ